VLQIKKIFTQTNREIINKKFNFNELINKSERIAIERL
ncbi:unnamed protein product, partial [marine sediment metagenome]